MVKLVTRFYNCRDCYCRTISIVSSTRYRFDLTVIVVDCDSDKFSCVVDIDERINRVFELSGLYKIIKQYKNIDEALKVI